MHMSWSHFKTIIAQIQSYSITEDNLVSINAVHVNKVDGYYQREYGWYQLLSYYMQHKIMSNSIYQFQ